MKKLTKKANEMNLKELSAYIDYSVLKPEFTEEEIIELTKDGVELGCATICINPAYIELCEPFVKGSGAIRTREHFLKLIDMGIDRMGIGYKSVPVVLDLMNESDKSTDGY